MKKIVYRVTIGSDSILHDIISNHIVVGTSALDVVLQVANRKSVAGCIITKLELLDFLMEDESK